VKVLLFGAGEQTGRLIAEALLAAGHEVTAFVAAGRRPTHEHERLEVVEGDATEQTAVDKAVLGKDCVVSAAGVTNRRPTTAYSDVAAAAVQAMGAAGPRRIICLSSGRVDADGPGLGLAQRAYLKLIIHRRYRNTLNDMERMEDELRESELLWTVLRPAPLTDRAAAGRVRTATAGHVPHPRPLSRAELARFVVDHLDDPATYGKVVEIAS
jgi:putative NADH-flavin reductase